MLGEVIHKKKEVGISNDNVIFRNDSIITVTCLVNDYILNFGHKTNKDIINMVISYANNYVPL